MDEIRADELFEIEPTPEIIQELKLKNNAEGSALYKINFGSIDEPKFVIIRRVNTRLYRDWQQSTIMTLDEDQPKNMLKYFIVFPIITDEIYMQMLPGEVDNLIQIISEKHGYVQYPVIEKL
jgi:hypothetical protein